MLQRGPSSRAPRDREPLRRHEQLVARMPLARTAAPTLARFDTWCAVSMCRYPTSSATRTACSVTPAVGDLPHPESEHRHHCPVGEDAAAPVGRQRAGLLDAAMP